MRNPPQRRGLRRPSSDFIGKARDETATQVTRIGLTFLGTSAFCLLSLLSPDIALLGVGSEKTNVINVPFAGPVSFFGFMLLGPAVLIGLRIYLQIYVEHSGRWDRLARSMSIARAPMLVPLQNPLIRVFSGLIFYLLLPVTMLLFAWKAAVFADWGSGLLAVAVAVVASHLMLPLKRFSWPAKALLSTGAALVVFAIIVGSGPVRRPFALFRASLSGQWLLREDLRGADLRNANLTDAKLRFARLTGADLSDADLTGADLFAAKLRGANLTGVNLTSASLRYAELASADLSLANLTGADLTGVNLKFAELNSTHLTHTKLSTADLSRASLFGARLTDADLGGANLSGVVLSLADLSGAKNLTQEQLDQACGDADTKLSEGLTLKVMCPPGPVGR